MRKLITLTDEQYKHFLEMMKVKRYQSFSEFVRYLALFYEENQKRPPGRPRSEDTDQDDGILYRNPDPHTTSPYTYDELQDWYAADPRRGEMPPRAELVPFSK